MGNLCTGPTSIDRRRKRQSRRAGSGSTTGFSPTSEDLDIPHRIESAAGVARPPGPASGHQRQRSRDGSGGLANGAGGHDDLSTNAVDVRVPQQVKNFQEQPQQPRLDHSRRSERSARSEDERDYNEQGSSDPPLNRSHRRESSRERIPVDRGSEDEQRSEKGELRDPRRHRKDGESRRTSKSGRRSGSGGDKADGAGGSRSKEGRGGEGEQRSNSTRSNRDKGSRRGGGDHSGRRPRSARTEEEIAERKARREREKAARANGEPQSEEARRERRERKERRERRKAKEAAATGGSSKAGEEGAGDANGGSGSASRRSSVTTAEPAAGFQGSTDSKREHRRSRRKAEAAAAATGAAEEEVDEGFDRPGLAGSGGGGAEGVRPTGEYDAAAAATPAGSIADTNGSSAGDGKKKRSSSLRKMYDSLTGGFSGSAAQQSAATGGSGGAGGGGTSSGKGRSSRGAPSSGSSKSQLVTSVTSRDVREKYEIERSQLGHGHYGVVRRCWDKETGEGYAIKTIKKSKVSRIESLRREIEILRCVDHPCIIKLYDVYEDERFIHLVTELCKGGELFDRIIQKTESEEGHYSEKDAKVVVASILSGIEYCHNEHNICHRDLKPENFLFKRPDSDTEIKIIDFGLSRFEDMQSAMTTRVGTPYYIAPEVLSRKYDKACDLWSIGVITYILLAGYPPFYGESDQEIFASVRQGYFDFPSPEWDNISSEAKDFIMQLLQKDPAARMTATQSIAHRWFARGDADDADATATAEEPRDKINMQVSMQRINHRLRRFVGMSKLKKVALNVIAQQLTEVEIGHLREVFERLDADGKGVISTNELEQVVQQEGLDNLQDDVVRLLQGIDIDGSNSLNYREFLAATMERNIFIREENIRCAFDYFDLDSNSEITLSNLVKIFGAEEHAREIMNDVNISGEGVINYDEFKSMMMEMPLDGRDPMTPRTPRTPRFLS